MPQISYLSTSPLLSDKRRYDYFFRTVPSDVNQVRAIVEILKFFKWNHVSIVYSDDEYGTRGLHEFELLARDANLCIASKQKLPITTDEWYMGYSLGYVPYEEILRGLLQSETKIVILFSDYKSAGMLFEAAHRAESLKDYIWIGSDAWGGREDLINDYPEITEGAITVQLSTRDLRDFSDHYSSLLPSPAVCQRNPFFCELWSKCDIEQRSVTLPEKHIRTRKHGLGTDCNMIGTNGTLGAHPMFHIDNLRDAIYAYAHALKALHNSTCGPSLGICETMRAMTGADMKPFLSKVSFTEQTGSSFKFYDESDGQPRYTIINQQRSRYPSRTGKEYHWVEIGKYTQDEQRRSTLILNQTAVKFKRGKRNYPHHSSCQTCGPGAYDVGTIKGDGCCSKCIKCEPWQYPMNFHCENCPPGFFVNTSFLLLHQNVSFFSRDVCVEIEAEFVGYHSVVAIPILSIAALGIILTFLSGGIIYFHRFTPIVKAAGREHLGILFIGIICTYAVNFVFLHQPSTWSCLVVRFLGTSYAICNSALLLKISRIYRIFNTREGKKTQKLKYISPKSHVAMTCAFIFVELVIIAVWSSFDPSYVKVVHTSRQHREVICSDLYDFKLLSGLCYPLMLLFPMAYLALRTRTCPAAFSEAQYTGYGIYLTFINLLTFVLIYIGNSQIQIRVVTVCIGTCLNASVLLITTYVTKVYVIVCRPHENSKEWIMNSGKSSGVRNTSSTANGSRPPTCVNCKILLEETVIPLTGRFQSNPELTAPCSRELVLQALINGNDCNKPRSRCNTLIVDEPHSIS